MNKCHAEGCKRPVKEGFYMRVTTYSNHYPICVNIYLSKA